MGIFSRRNPLGSYSRPTPDWFNQNAGIVGGFYWASTPVDVYLDLSNEDQQGQYCHVYNLMIGNDAAGIYQAFAIKGHGANLMQQARAVNVGNAPPSVNLYWDTGAPLYSGSHFPQDTPFSTDMFLDNEAGSEDQYRVNGPLFVLPSGYSLRVSSFVSSTEFGGGFMTATFYFVMLPDQG